MSHRELGQVVLGLQVRHIRSTLAKEIEELESCFRIVLQQIGIFILVTEKHFHSTSITILNANTVTSLLVRFIGYSNNILGYLDFLELQTGLPSGGDDHLQNKVLAMTCFVEGFLSALIAHSRAVDFPGKDLGLIYNKNVKLLDESVLHRNTNVNNEEGELPDIHDPNTNTAAIIRRQFHPEPIGYPLSQVPGTPWHKFFGNIRPNHQFDPADLFKRKARGHGFLLSIPSTFEWIEDDVWEQYRNFGNVFDLMKLERIQQRLLNYFDGEYSSVDQIFHYDEDTSEFSRPEHDVQGRTRFEALNSEINTPELGGVAILGGNAPAAVNYLESDELFFRFQSFMDAEWA
ncbi:hypothetical protein QBC43DRAFT_359679 [Cladorrhinum sp. PSN259]|nr:hypothetical protein QBC43DRAFT_359679 [Cladorrhinum sp. PSN259]